MPEDQKDRPDPSASLPGEEASPGGTEGAPMNVSMLQNIPVTLSVDVGRAVLKISDLLKLSQGSVVELDRIAGEPLDLLVNNTVIAQGEVVMVNERYGIRLTRVITPAERLREL
jgi:flagellar motor switch protein FliN/FliY